MNDIAVNIFDLNLILPCTFQASPIEAPSGSFDYSILFQSQFDSPIKSPTIHDFLLFLFVLLQKYFTKKKSKLCVYFVATPLAFRIRFSCFEIEIIFGNLEK
jgi:hypothetical protein